MPKEKPQHLIIDISWTALFRIIGLAAAIWVAYFLREILLMLFTVFIFVAAVNPEIRKLEKKMSRGLAVTLFYALILVIISLISYSFIPLLIHQVNELIGALPSIEKYVRNLLEGTSAQTAFLDRALNTLTGSLQDISGNAIGTLLGIFGGLATLATGLVMSFYLLLEDRNAKEFFHQILPENRFKPVYITVSKISERMGSWVRGQLALMFIIGLSNFVAFVILGVKTPLPLAIWAGIAEVIPYVGPFIGMVPAAAVALTTNGVLQAVLVFIVSFGLIQQLEAHIVVPKVMGKAVGLSPVLVIIALLIGVKAFGLFGGIIALPAAAVISVVVGEWTNLRTIWESANEE